MKINQLVKKNSLNLLYSLLIILPSILTGNIYSLISEENSNTYTLSNLSAISSSINNSLEQAQNYYSYSLNLLLRNEDFLNFNIAAMSKHISEFIYHTPTIANVYIIDQSHTILYGINDTRLSGLQYSAHIDRALEGSLGFYTDFIDNRAFSQFAFPIANSDAEPLIHGALIVTYDFTPIEEEFKALTSSSPSLDGYLFDTNGRLVASSTPFSSASSTQRIDILNISQGIDYSPFTTFTLFDDTPLLGNYHILDDTNWMILITSTTSETPNYADMISWFSGFLSLGGISSFKLIKNKKNMSCTADLPAEISETLTVDETMPFSNQKESSTERGL